MLSARPSVQGAAYGLTAAALFGVSPPLTKLLLPQSGPLLIAGLLYLGAGLGLLAFEELYYRRTGAYQREARVRRSDVGRLAVIVVSGGILGPVFMLWGLQRLTGVLTSLLLNLEAPLTILLAVAFFREHLGRVQAAGALLILVGAALLQYQPGELRADGLGIMALFGACVCWALDNNVSQQLSLRDPVVVTRIKTLGAGVGSLSLALLTGQQWPALWVVLAGLLLGLVSYGLSLVLDMRALRLVGAAREAGFFATAPFIGAMAAVPILGERWGWAESLATVLMAMGVFVLIRDYHGHRHTHECLEHDHVHRHGDHHRHEHDEHLPMGEPHTHVHRHIPLTHDHPHVSELHHRHPHAKSAHKAGKVTACKQIGNHEA